MKNKVILVVVSVIALGAAFFFGINKYRSSEAQRVGFMAEKNFSTFVRDYSPRLGPENPKVYLVEFLDPECESCRVFYGPVKEILKEFKDQVQLVIRYAPFHGNSVFAIGVLEGARKQNKYWEALEILFANQPSWGDHHHPQPELIWNFLAEAGIDVEKIKAQMDDPQTVKMIEQEIEDGKALGVRQTPSFFINGKALQTFSLEDLRLAVKSELEAP